MRYQCLKIENGSSLSSPRNTDQQCESTDIQEASSSTASHIWPERDFFFFFFSKTQYSAIFKSQPERVCLCSVFSLAHACLCLQRVLGRQTRGLEEEEEERRRGAGCRGRKFVFVQRATRQQHSCNADFNNLYLHTHRYTFF